MLNIVTHFRYVYVMFILSDCYAKASQEYKEWEERSLKDCRFLENVSWRDGSQHQVAPMSIVRLELMQANRHLQVQWTQESNFQGDVHVLTTPLFQDFQQSGPATCTAAKLQLQKGNDFSGLKSLNRRAVITLVGNVTSYVLDIGHRENGSVIVTRLLLQLPKMTQTKFCKSKQRSNNIFTDLMIPFGVHIVQKKAEISITPPASTSSLVKVEVYLTLVTWELYKESQQDSELCKDLETEFCYKSTSEEQISFDGKSTNPVLISLKQDTIYQLWVDYVMLENDIEETCRVSVKSPKFSLNSTGKSFENITRTDHINFSSNPVLDNGELGIDSSVNKTQHLLPNQIPISAKVMEDVSESNRDDRITVIIGVTAGSLAALLAIIFGVSTCMCIKGKGFLRVLKDEKTQVIFLDDTSPQPISKIKILKDHTFHCIPTTDDKCSAITPPADYIDDVKETFYRIHPSPDNYELPTSPRHSKSNLSDLSSSSNDGLCGNVFKTQSRDLSNSYKSINTKLFTNSDLFFEHSTLRDNLPRGKNSIENMFSRMHSLRLTGTYQSLMSLEHLEHIQDDESFPFQFGEPLLWSTRNLLGAPIIPPNTDGVSLTSNELVQALDGINEFYTSIVGTRDSYDTNASSSQLWECATVCEETAC